MKSEQTEIEEIPSRPMTDEDRYYEELGYKDPVETTTRIEDTAKYLMGIAAGTSGLYLSAFKLTIGRGTVSELIWFIPFLFWSASIISLILVIFPQKYETCKNEPDSLKRAVLKARERKYWKLFAGTVFFIFGILSGVLPFVL